MLDTLRRAAQSWLAKLLLIVLVLSFGVWGISGTMFQGAGNSVVTVGDTRVTQNEFLLAYNRQVSLISQQLQRYISREQARSMGVEAQTLSIVATSAALDEQSRRMNLGLSEDRLAGIIRDDPAFQGINGRFDEATFDAVLRNSGFTPESFITSQQNAAIRTQIVDAIADGYEAPAALLEAFNRFQNEKRTVDYLFLDRTLIGDIADPTDEEASKYFEENKSRYRAPEYRKISYVTLTAVDISDPAAVAENLVRDEYERTKDRYTTPEERTIEQLNFASREDAEAAASELEQGKSFDELLSEQGKTADDVNLGTFSKAAVPDQLIADAAFSIESQGGASGVIEGAFGPVILRVTSITPGATKSFEEVEPEIRQEMALVDAGNILLDVHDAYEDARAAGDTLVEAATKQQLTPVTIDAVDRTGRDPSGQMINDLPERATLLQEAFEADINIDSPPISIGSDGFLWYEVNDITPSRDRTLDEVRDQVVADWKNQQTDAELAKLGEELRKRLSDGEDLNAIGAEYGLTPDTKYDIGRNDQDALFGADALNAAFSGPQGHVALASDPDNTARILLKVQSVTTPSPAEDVQLPPAAVSAISDSISNDILGQAVRMMQEEFGVTVNARLADLTLSQSY
ncbi:SurA N-terminal domain-containing protein [Hoeflea sp. WL0058]|uniref:Parvulin-like PPIase n=1 Tax=Flavimaribacter sediminis TaxID=2865987 RepID=A0AAE2ZJ41_9HYPH|nr:SurA N-terminal domain-containing protein [Flavimaribacter sediminis]MBW8636914.1 SurA N-terminal domain-containing protein [Flavimaribacter sediminis]